MGLNAKVNRRDFLKLGGAAVIGSLPIINSACKNSSTLPEPLAHDVTVSVTFYNHTQGLLGEKAYQGKSNQSLDILVSELGFEGVDRRIAVRQTAPRETMGNFVAFSRTGRINMKYPENNESWEAYIMNATNGTSYDMIDNMGEGWGRLIDMRYSLWHRRDIGTATGPEEPLLEAAHQLNEALNYPWKSYGTFTKTDDRGLGIGYCDDPDYGTRNYVYIVPSSRPTMLDKLNGFISNIFHYNTLTAKSTVPESIICDEKTGNLNAIGKDLLNYVYVKDAHYD
jgi:hypothetical protein